MVGRRHDNYITRKLVELHQQKGDDPLNLARFVSISPLFPNSVKLIEEKNARLNSNVIE